MVNTYRTVQGDFFDDIAYRLYGSERYGVSIMTANPGYADVVRFAAGITLTIPQVASSTNVTSVPWGKLFVSK